MELPGALASGLRRPSVQRLAALCAYLLIALVWSHPLAFQANSHVALPEATPKPVVMAKDQLFAVSAAGRNAAALLEGDPARLIDARLCWPMPRSATLGEHAVELGILALPGWALTRDPLVAYNSACLLLVMLAALGAFALVQRFTGSGAAAFTAGLLFGFHPGLIGNLAHPFVIGIHWLPWVLLAFERLVEAGRVRDAAGLAAAATLQAWVGSYPLLVLAAFALPYGLVRLGQERARLDLRRLVLLAAAGACVAAATFAVLRFYPEAGAAWGVLGRRVLILAPFGSLLPGGIHAVGAVVLVLAVAALAPWPRDGGPAPAALAGASLCLLLAGGVGEEGAQLSGLYPWLADRIWLLGVARVPAEVRSGVYLGAALLAGLGMARLLSRSAARWRPALALGASLLAMFELFQPTLNGAVYGYPRSLVLLPRAPAADTLAAYAALGAAGLDGPLLELPHEGSLRTLSEHSLRSAYHQRETAACFSSHVPPSFLAVERMAGRLPEARGAEELSAAGLRQLVVHSSPATAGLVDALAAHPDVELLFETPQVAALVLPESGAVHHDAARLEVRAARMRTQPFARKLRRVLEIDVRNGGESTWALPHPVAPHEARLRWWPKGGGEAGAWLDRRLLLPLALAAGAEDRLWMELGDPPEDCDCLPELEVPTLGWHIPPDTVRVE